MTRHRVIIGVAAATLALSCKKKETEDLYEIGLHRDGGPAVVVVGGKSEQAVATSEESEPNDDPLAVKVAPLPLAVGGALDGAGDKDAFAFELASPAQVTVRLAGADDVDLVLDLLDAGGKRLLRSDNGPAGTAEGFPNPVLQPGVYRLVISEFVKKANKGAVAPRQGPSGRYVLEVRAGGLPAPGEEAEPNDEAAFAGELAMGGSAQGYVGWRRDADLWRVPLDEVGDDDALSVDVDGVPDVRLRVAVLDGTEAILMERRGAPGEAVALRNVAVRAGEPHYFVRVGCDRGNLDARYTVRVSSAPFQVDEESEPNDAPDRANPLSDIPGTDSGVRTGFLVRGDVDVYQVEPVSRTRRLHVTAEPPPSVDIVLSVVDAAGAVLAGPANSEKRGGRESLSDVLVPAGASVYVRLEIRSGGSDLDRYRLRWSAVEAEAPTPIPGIDLE